MIPYQTELTAPDRAHDKGFEAQALHTFAHLRKDLVFGGFYDELPDPIICCRVEMLMLLLCLFTKESSPCDRNEPRIDIRGTRTIRAASYH